MSDPQQRRRWITLGELIALAALVISGLGVWISWKSISGNADDKPTRIVEQKQSIPLVLRGRPEDDGRRLIISPVEDSHALESLVVTVPGAKPIEVGSDGELDARALEDAVTQLDKDKSGHSVKARVATRYVEMGADRQASGSYTLRYRWDGGGLFGSRSLRLTGLSRS